MHCEIEYQVVPSGAGVLARFALARRTSLRHNIPTPTPVVNRINRAFHFEFSRRPTEEHCVANVVAARRQTTEKETADRTMCPDSSANWDCLRSRHAHQRCQK